MAVNFNEWKDKLKGLEPKQVTAWIIEAGSKGLTPDELANYLLEKYDVWNNKERPEGSEMIDSFKDKWSVDPLTGLDIEKEKVDKPIPVKKVAPKKEIVPVKVEQPVLVQEPEKAYEGEELTSDEIDGNIRAAAEEMGINPDEVDVEDEEVEEVEEEQLPFDNPDLNAEAAEPEEVPAPKPRIRPLLSMAPRKEDPFIMGFGRGFNKDEDFISKKIGIQEYKEILKPYQAYFERTKTEPKLIHDYAMTIDMRNHPPYMTIRPIIINNNIKDPNNTKVLMNTINPEQPDRVAQKMLPLTQCIEVTRLLIEQGYLQSGINNYDSIVEKMEEERALMAELIYILEVYCESKDHAPLEFNIPKAYLTQAIIDSFQEIKTLIAEKVVSELKVLRTDMKSDLGSVGDVLEKNMDLFGEQIRDAISRVFQKVKTDIEQTNLEDVKRGRLWIRNKRKAAYGMGSIPIAILSFLLDDLEERLDKEDFKIDQIAQYRRYTIEEMRQRLGNRTNRIALYGIHELKKANLIILWKDKTISLAK
jgi:hypothetical protein